MTVNRANIINEPLVPRDKIIIPTLDIKLGLIKQFVKALPVDGLITFAIFCQEYVTKNLKPGCLMAHRFETKIMRNPGYVESMTVVESAAWIFFLLLWRIFWATP